MRIHTDTLNVIDLFEAARIARADVTYTAQGSRSRDHSFDVTLTGFSKRRPNSGKRGASWSSEYAATWDQWGVFFAVLFDRDPSMFCGIAKRPAYRDRAHFHWATDDRFRSYGIVGPDVPGALAVTGDPGWDGTHDGPVYRREQGYWPDDAHGDHTFRPTGTMGESKCTRCSAVKRWEITLHGAAVLSAS
jgi:hypothetical protein